MQAMTTNAKNITTRRLTNLLFFTIDHASLPTPDKLLQASIL